MGLCLCVNVNLVGGVVVSLVEWLGNGRRKVEYELDHLALIMISKDVSCTYSLLLFKRNKRRR